MWVVAVFDEVERKRERERGSKVWSYGV